jgi:hypothetical protein
LRQIKVLPVQGEGPGDGARGHHHLAAAQRNEYSNQELFYRVKEAHRLHCAIGYKPSAPATLMPSNNFLERQLQIH